MKSRPARPSLKSQKHRILCVLKRRGALSVTDLMEVISLSYMGVKQHCIELERDGRLVKKRKPKPAGRGRPEQMYELTPAAEDFFPCHDTPLTRQIMSALRHLYGTSAPEKILFTIYQEIIQVYRQKMTAMLFEDRIQEFLRLRERDGYLVDAAPPSEKNDWLITECHSPIAGLLKEFPILLNFELQIYQKALHPQVKRIRHSSNPYRIVYGIPTPP